jgi:hypothetical protein
MLSQISTKYTCLYNFIGIWFEFVLVCIRFGPSEAIGSEGEVADHQFD